MKKLICLIVTLLITISSVQAYAVGDERDAVRLPILMYHSISNAQDDFSITPEVFESNLKTITDYGYTPVTFQNIIDYVYSGSVLPNRPILITFDDGYTNNYTEAFPILKRYGYPATIFAIGSSVGKSYYKDTANAMNPHFNYNQAREMNLSKLISVQSHTYDMHQWADFEDADTPRENVLRFEDESVLDYARVLQNDFSLFKKVVEGQIGHTVNVVAYPSGRYDATSEAVLRSMGVKATVSTSIGVNYVKKFNPESLYMLNRYNMNSTVTNEVLSSWLRKDAAEIDIKNIAYNDESRYMGGIKVYVNGQLIEYTNPPMLKSSTTMVPMRSTLEAMGATVNWDDNTKTAKAVLNTDITKFSIGSAVYYTNGKPGYLPLEALLVEGSTYIPLRAIAESFGCIVDWDDATGTVSISTEDKIYDNIYYIIQNGVALSAKGNETQPDGMWITKQTGENTYEAHNLGSPDIIKEITTADGGAYIDGTQIELVPCL